MNQEIHDLFKLASENWQIIFLYGLKYLRGINNAVLELTFAVKAHDEMLKKHDDAIFNK